MIKHSFQKKVFMKNNITHRVKIYKNDILKDLYNDNISTFVLFSFNIYNTMLFIYDFQSHR